MEAPFSDRSKLLWREQASTAHFGFWSDFQSGELLVRGFDLSIADEKWNEPLLEFWSFKVKVGTSTEGIRAQLTANVNEMIDYYPFVGILEPSGFFTWSSKSKVPVSIVKRTGVKRHPYLPMLFDFSTANQKGGVATLEEEAKGLVRLHFEEEMAFEPTQRLWLKERNAKGRGKQ